MPWSSKPIEPFDLRQRLAFRAVSIAAGVVGGTLEATGITLLEVASETAVRQRSTACITLRWETGNGWWRRYDSP
jgi:hypothetical protein